MAKNTQAKTDTAFAAFDAATATDQIRAFTEKGIEQSGKAYAFLKDNTEAVQKAVEESFETAKSNGNQWSLKALSALRANTEAGFDHLEALAGVTTLSQFIELQTAFVRRQSEAAVDQVKEVQVAASKAAEDMLRPVKDAYSKAFAELKLA
jgi:phasin